MTARPELWWSRALLVPVIGLGLVLGVVACSAGGASGPTTETTEGLATTTSAATTPWSPTVTTGRENKDGDIASLFGELAAAAAPMTVFAPTYLPADATLEEYWLPVIDSPKPEGYAGPPVSNPQVLGSGADSEMQVILRSAEGWLAIVENFRGDLGDVSGLPVGSVAGNAATLYEVNGGDLVQWSRDGLWYGVFGRGVSRDETIAVALGMQPVSEETE
jgi:hypothetical protein